MEARIATPIFKRRQTYATDNHVDFSGKSSGNSKRRMQMILSCSPTREGQRVVVNGHEDYYLSLEAICRNGAIKAVKKQDSAAMRTRNTFDS